MVCVYCGSETKVTNSRHQKRTNQVWRRRQCLKCTALFTTEEKTDHTSLWKVKKNNEETLVAFSRDKLFLSIYKSCEHRLNALADAASLT
jgi:transcriptional regulator NrdR family protein